MMTWLHLGRWSVYICAHRNVHLGWWTTGSGLREWGRSWGSPWLTVEALRRGPQVPSRWGIAKDCKR